ncbi:MAG: hypothetical protein JZU63_12490, partial [Rhodoferax sp.]|nr:hypothetical protein [Rhodoferax sp.]
MLGHPPGQRALKKRCIGAMGGHVQSWRNELFGFWPEGATWQGAQPPDPRVPHAFRMERACFRFFGLKSHAVHINGFRADGHMWCGRRALTKATD